MAMYATGKDLELQKLSIERKKLILEQRKMSLERNKLEMERSKVRWTAAAVIVSVLTGGATIVYGAWSVHRTAQDQFAAKLAEITFASDNPDVGAGKASAIGYLFGDRLPPDIKAKLTDVTGLRQELLRHAKGISQVVDDDVSLESQKDLLRSVLQANPRDRKRVIGTWEAMFPGDKVWAEQFAQRLPRR